MVVETRETEALLSVTETLPAVALAVTLAAFMVRGEPGPAPMLPAVETATTVLKPVRVPVEVMSLTATRAAVGVAPVPVIPPVLVMPALEKRATVLPETGPVTARSEVLAEATKEYSEVLLAVLA